MLYIFFSVFAGFEFGMDDCLSISSSTQSVGFRSDEHNGQLVEPPPWAGCAAPAAPTLRHKHLRVKLCADRLEKRCLLRRNTQQLLKQDRAHDTMRALFV